MGKVVYPNKKTSSSHKVKVIDPTPIWIGTTKDSNIKRMMTAEEAERWVKEDPYNRKLTAYTIAGKLRKVN